MLTRLMRLINQKLLSKSLFKRKGLLAGGRVKLNEKDLLDYSWLVDEPDETGGEKIEESPFTQEFDVEQESVVD